MRDPRFDEAAPWQRERPPSDEAIAQAKELARGIAHAGRVDLGAVRDAAARFGYGRRIVWHAFHDTLRSLLIADDTSRHAWVGALEDAITVSAHDIERLDKHGEARQEAEAWRRVEDPLAVWKRQWNDGVPDRRAPSLESWLLLSLDQKAWIDALDRLPMPSWMWSLVWMSNIEDDRDLIVELLERAPAVFDEQGRWTHSVAALLVTDRIIQHARHLQRNESEKQAWYDDDARRSAIEKRIDNVERKELPDWFNTAYEGLLRRSDGRIIAYGLLDSLSRRVLQGRDSVGKSDWFAERAAFDALIDVLVRAGASVDEIRDFCERRSALKEREKKEEDSDIPRIEPGRTKRRPAHFGEGRRSYYFEAFPLVYAAACILNRAAASPGQANSFWSWFSELLEGRAPGLGIAIHSRTQLDALEQIGRLLARLPSPHAAWEATYRKLEPQRRRHQVALLRYDDQDADEPTIVLVQMGLSCCAVLAEQTANQDARQHIRSFFWRLYEVARRLWLTDTYDSSDSKKTLVALCFAFIPEIFGDDLRAALARAVPPIATDPWILSLAACYLRVNRVEPLRIARLFSEAGADLIAALRDTHQWSELTGLENEFPPHFRALSDALGISFDETEAPDSDEERLRRQGVLFPKHVSRSGS
jgi:hypothetical protein